MRITKCDYPGCNETETEQYRSENLCQKHKLYSEAIDKVMEKIRKENKMKKENKFHSVTTQELELIKILIAESAKMAELHAPEGNEKIWAYIEDAQDIYEEAKKR